jgi:hypothetical protein
MGMPVLDFLGNYKYSLRKMIEARYRNDANCRFSERMSQVATTGIQPKHSDDKLEQRLAGCEADLIIVGHTHIPLDRRVGEIHVINLGSVSNPVTSGLQATYVLLDADVNGYSIQLRRVDYDREAVIKAIEQSHHPTPSFLIGFMRGERVTSSDPGFFQAGRRAKNQKEQ